MLKQEKRSPLIVSSTSVEGKKILLKCGKNKLLNVDELPLMDPRVAEAAAACLDYASGGWVRNAKVHRRPDLKDANSALICQQVVFQLRTQQQSALVGGLPGGDMLGDAGAALASRLGA